MKKIKIRIEESSVCASKPRDIAINVSKEQLDEDLIGEGVCEIDIHHDLYEQLQGAIDEDGETPCPECLYEMMVDASCGCSEMISEAEYKGR